MDLYLVLKFLHILTATIWVGGGFVFMVASEVAQRAPGPVYGGFASVAARLGNLVFVPAAMATLVLGIILTITAWNFSDLWILLALAGIAFTMGFGMIVVKPATDRIAESTQSEGADSPRVRGMSAALLRKGRFDLTLMAVIIADMVLKPGYGDVATLSVLGACLILAAVLFLVRPPRPTRAAA
ncbi:MAG: DUF2269 family protein [Devosia sp.]